MPNTNTNMPTMKPLLLALGVVIVGVGIAGGTPQRGDQASQVPSARNLPQNLAPTAPVGSPAITPHLAGVPAFTIDDAKAYVTTHALALGLRRDYSPTTTRAEFLTSRQVSERLHGASTGFPADRVLCYVELQGTFSFVGPSGTHVTYPRRFFIFDAQTGHLVINGGLP